MTTFARLSRLEAKLSKRTNQQGVGTIWGGITADGRILDKDEFVMTDTEVIQVEKEHSELLALGYKIWYEVSPYEPKLKRGSTTIPYHIRSHSSGVSG